MVVLDADSVMSGDYVLQLAMMMQTNPRAGIIQTTPLPVRQHTLFGRMYQFSAVTFGDIFSHGFSFWAVDAGTYVGQI